MAGLFSSVRRTAAALTSHGELGMAVYGAKCEGEGLKDVGHHHMHAVRSMKEWAAKEDNVCIQAIYVKLAELSLLQQELYVNYAEQFHDQRRALKTIIRREKTLEDVKKQTEELKANASKLNKKLVHCRSAKKVDPQKAEALEAEYNKAKALEEESVHELNIAEKNHECFKFWQIKGSVKEMTAASRTFHQQSIQILDTEDQVREILLPKMYEGCTKEAVTTALIEATNIVNDLAEALHLNTPSSLVEKNSQLEHLIQNDRMLNADPLYETGPEREVPDADQLRRPLPLPPMVDNSDSSDDDYEYTEPYQDHLPSIIDRLTRSPRPSRAPAPPPVNPSDPPSPHYYGARPDADYLEVFDYDAPDQWYPDGIQLPPDVGPKRLPRQPFYRDNTYEYVSSQRVYDNPGQPRYYDIGPSQDNTGYIDVYDVSSSPTSKTTRLSASQVAASSPTHISKTSQLHASGVSQTNKAQASGLPRTNTLYAPGVTQTSKGQITSLPRTSTLHTSSVTQTNKAQISSTLHTPGVPQTSPTGAQHRTDSANKSHGQTQRASRNAKTQF